VAATYAANGPAPRDAPAVDAIAVDLHESLSRPVAAWVARCSAAGVPVVSTITLYETLAWRIPLSEIPEDRLPLDFVRGASLYRPFKRAIDVTAALVLALPGLLIGGAVALAVLIADGRPILMRQRRVGEGGRGFDMLKFRTMRVDAEADGPKQARDADPRVIRGGTLLRRFRLDEIPQIWNVLADEMSLIGPRPERPEFVEEYRERLPYYELRHAVKPGLTGWAQVQQGYASGDAETATKLEYDLYYVKHASVWLDLYIVVRTLRTILTGFGSR
jgi:lipopolysaccharide/colanic/teichoic acid biosynthesis glycosyltransferase